MVEKKEPVSTTDLITRKRHDLAVPVEIPKTQMGALPIWLGRRYYTEADIQSFRRLDNLYGLYPTYLVSFEFLDADRVDKPYPALIPLDKDIRKELGRIIDPLAIFIITSAEVAERPWVQHMSTGLMDVRKEQGLDQTTFVYSVILGSGFSQEGKKDPDGHFSRNAMRAQELGSVYLPYNTDYPTVSTRRLVEFMNRVLGCDLPGNNFPNYSHEDLMKIAWHISKEDFNSVFPREGAIPKYSIVDGKPKFTF